jgi:hypothetical protein
MPVWRPRPDWFRDAVASALGQTGCDLELVVVDDGSPEPVAPLLSDITDPRLRVVRIEHGGLSRGRNAGIAAARGDRLRFIDGDDLFPPASTSHLSHLMGRDRVIAYGATLVCDEKMRPQSMMVTDTEGDASVECLLFGFDTRVHSMLFPRSVVEAAGDWDPSFRVCQDWDFVLRALDHAPVRGDRQIATHYRRHRASSIGNVHDDIMEDALTRIVEGYFVRHPDQKGTSLHRRARVALDANYALGLARRKRYARSAKRLLHAIGMDPGLTVAELRRALRRRVDAPPT